MSPLGFSLAFLAFALIQLCFKRIKRGITLAITAFIWLWIWSTPLASYLLQKQMESAYPPLSIEAVPNAEAIVLLGGAVASPSLGFPYASLYSGADRVWHAARLYQAGKAPWVVLSGGADLGLVLHPVQLPVFKYVFIDLGATQYKEKQLGNVSTSLGGYSQSQNQSGMGKFYGLGYDLPMGASTDLRFSLNHYDSIGGDSALKSNLASVGVTRRF